MLGDPNGWVGDRLRMGINDRFDVPGENYNGRRVIDFCAEMRLCVGNTSKTRVCISTPRWLEAKEEWSR